MKAFMAHIVALVVGMWVTVMTKCDEKVWNA